MEKGKRMQNKEKISLLKTDARLVGWTIVKNFEPCYLAKVDNGCYCCWLAWVKYKVLQLTMKSHWYFSKLELHWKLPPGFPLDTSSATTTYCWTRTKISALNKISNLRFNWLNWGLETNQPQLKWQKHLNPWLTNYNLGVDEFKYSTLTEPRGSWNMVCNSEIEE